MGYASHPPQRLRRVLLQVLLLIGLALVLRPVPFPAEVKALIVPSGSVPAPSDARSQATATARRNREDDPCLWAEALLSPANVERPLAVGGFAAPDARTGGAEIRGCR